MGMQKPYLIISTYHLLHVYQYVRVYIYPGYTCKLYVGYIDTDRLYRLWIFDNISID